MNRFTQWFQAEPSTDGQDERLFWRERILSVVLIGGAILGIVAYLTNLTQVIPNRQWEWLIIYTLALTWVIVIATVRRISYFIRATNMLAILLILGVVSALQFGAAGDARVWLMGFAVLSGVFLGLRAGGIASTVSLLVYLGIGWIMNQGLIPAPTENAILQPSNMASWVTTGVSFVAINLIMP